MSFKRICKNTLHFVTGTRLLQKQFQYTKTDLVGFATNAKNIRARLKKAKGHCDEWNNFVLEKGITASSLMMQYRKRRLLGFILLFAAFYSLYFLIYDHYIAPGLAGALISMTYYLKNTLRLYQIRHRHLCSFIVYLKAIQKTFKEGLPLALPKNWCLMSIKSQGKSHDV